MRPPIDGGTILITGASSGIGREMARQLAPRARALAVVARRRERLEELRSELVAAHPRLVVSVQACDLTDLESSERMVAAVQEELGDVDILINNAGFGDIGMFDRADWNKTQQMIRVNVETLTYLTHRLLAGMVARRRGGILNVSSGFGLNFMPGFSAYVGTKHYVTSFTECLRLETRSAGVVVSQVCPGPTETEFNEVMGVPGGLNAPALSRLTPARSARWALWGFERDRALISPGYIMKLLYFLGAWTPRWFLRLIYAPVGNRMRKLQAKLLAAETEGEP